MAVIGKNGNFGGTVYRSAVSTSGFNIAVTTALAASQPAGTFSVDYIVVGTKIG